MKLRSFRTALFAFFALFLGAGQGVCAATMPAVSGADIAANTHDNQMPEGHGAAAHDHHQKSDNHKPTSHSPHSNDCPHCASTHAYKALTKSSLGVSVDLPHVVKAGLRDALAAYPHAGYAQDKPVALFRRYQPSQTPITLKSRLQI